MLRPSCACVRAALVLAVVQFAGQPAVASGGADPAAATPRAARAPTPPTSSTAPVGIAATETVFAVAAAERPLEGIPGGATVVTREELERRGPVGIDEALRATPGVHLRTDETTGLIPNIGVRGLNPDRSSKLLFLEDGLPAALAPYNENAAYYAPPVERFERIELVKGSGSILHGPQTVGGVLNFVTRRPPAEPSGSFTGVLGTDAWRTAHLEYGASGPRAGFHLDAVHRSGDGFQDQSDFRLDNLAGQVRIRPTPASEIVVRANWQDQESQRTYLGLTSTLFEADPKFKMAPDDLLEVRWLSESLAWRQYFDRGEVTVALYHADADRKWNRQDFARNGGFAAPPANTVAVLGDESIDGGAVFLRSSFDARDRSFDYWGVEPRALLEWGRGALAHRTWFGARAHFETMFDERNVSDSLGAARRTRQRERRHVEALAVFAQHEFRIEERWSIVPGLRFEDFTQSRQFAVKDFAASDVAGKSSTSELIPGLGVAFRPVAGDEVFFGVHRGFAPARTSQAVTSSGVDAELEAELSWNWELGWRRTRGAGAFEAALFLLDFENQVIPASESGGASTADTNAGRTRHEGVELGGSFDLFARRAEVRAAKLVIGGTLTLQDTENVTPNGRYRGKELPYAPRAIARTALDWAGAAGVSVGVEVTHSSDHFSDQESTVASSADGTVGRLDAVTLLNLRAAFAPPSGRWRLSAHLDNVLDERYVASRAPQGIFPGAFRQLRLGATMRF